MKKYQSKVQYLDDITITVFIFSEGYVFGIKSMIEDDMQQITSNLMAWDISGKEDELEKGTLEEALESSIEILKKAFDGVAQAFIDGSKELVRVIREDSAQKRKDIDEAREMINDPLKFLESGNERAKLMVLKAINKNN